MKSVLVVYGTTEGQTRKIAEFIANALMASTAAPIMPSLLDMVNLLIPVVLKTIPSRLTDFVSGSSG